MASLEPRDLVVLLPRLPVTYAIVGPPGAWPETLERWGSTPAAGSPDLAVVTAGRPSVEAETTLHVRGRARPRASRVRMRYAVRAVGSGEVELHPVARGWRTIVVDGRESATPAAIVASGGVPCTSARVSADPRRRVALLTGDAVVKVPREPGQGGRGRAEQATLSDLERLGVTRVPRGLGAGEAGAIAWSSETRVAGSPADTLVDPSRARSVLSGLASWLGVMAERTRHNAPRDDLPLRGPYAATGSLVSELGDVACVLQHGDLASGMNVLVDGDEFSVIDWETARPHGLPLLDLLPILCLGLARTRGTTTARAQADLALRLCRGDDPDSRWLLDHVRRYAAVAGVAEGALGRLAALAWAYQASMRLVHEELVVAAGREPVPWTSSAEHVAAAWMQDERLGVSWPALTGSA